MLRHRLGALAAAAVLAAGLAAAAHPATPSAAPASAVVAGQWSIYSLYTAQWACQEKGEWLVNVMEYFSNYYCARPGSMWELWVYSP